MELDERLIRKVASYKVTQEALAPIREVPLLFMVGIAAAGKNAIQQGLVDAFSDKYRFIVSHTTRAPRENAGVLEDHGVHYYFVDVQTVGRMMDSQEFVEAKVIHADYIYGTSIAEIKKAGDQGKVATTDLDVQGVAEYMTLGLNVKPVFVLPPSYDEWMHRLLKRYNGHVDRRELHNRMKSALKELEHALEVDYFYIVINDDLDKTIQLVDDIAHGKPVEPHYGKAMAIAEEMLSRLKKELGV